MDRERKKDGSERRPDTGFDGPVTGDVDSSPPSSSPTSHRFSSVLDAGRAIARALRRVDVYRAVDESVLSLLHGPSSTVLEAVDDEVGYKVAIGKPVPAVFLPLVALTAAEQIPLTRTVEGEGTALCASIVASGRVVAWFMVVHSDENQVFDQDQQRLAEFVATLAGAALENAEGFARVKELSRTLENRVRERTAELRTSNEELSHALSKMRESQGRMVHSGKMAAVGSLVAGLSHELNNPLSVVLGYSQLLLSQTAADDENRGPLEAIETQALRCASLVRSLLEFSRKPRRRERTSAPALVHRVVELMRGHARKRGVELSVGLLDAGLSRPKVAVQDIESALLGLVSNALDATESGGSVVVTVGEATRNEASGLRLAVQDTGSGISEADLAQIFDAFFTTKPVGEGVGLSLSIAHQIVSSHDGFIDVETAVGKGTIMSIWLPD